MSSALNRRLDALENRLATQEAETIRVIVMREDTEGHAEPESVIINQPNKPPQRVNRKPAEPATAFLNRAGCVSPSGHSIHHNRV